MFQIKRHTYFTSVYELHGKALKKADILWYFGTIDGAKTLLTANSNWQNIFQRLLKVISQAFIHYSDISRQYFIPRPVTYFA
jgi:hypothetical protein